MSAAIEDGGNAFPTVQERGPHGDIVEWAQPGMSLRDHFAGLAMQGMLAQSIGTALGSDPRHGAEYAYAMADAMIQARKAQP